MKNCHELRVTLAAVTAQLRAGEITTKEAMEIANLAGKMVASAKVQVEYYARCETQPHIQFLEEPEAPK